MSYSLPLRIHAIDTPAQDVRMFTLRHAQDMLLPAFTAGAHIELKLTSELARSYSLLNAPGETHQYQIAVHNSPTSKGGSRWMHENLQMGQVVHCTEPRNHFPVNEQAEHSCLIGGGIGITPLMAMAKCLSALGKSWELHYCTRTPSHAGWMQELQALASEGNNTVTFHFDQVPGGQPLDLKATVKAASVQTHFYCCGPSGMLQAFEAATAHCLERSHVEYFSAKSEAALDGGYEIELVRSGMCLKVPSGRTILDVVTDAGINVLTSCREGICGSCETRLISGEADHRDAVLSPAEQAANESMMICCSGARSARLVLDL